MELNLPEIFLLLSLRPDRPGFLIPIEKLNPGMIGAIFMELSLKNMMEVKDKRLIIKKLPKNLNYPFDEIVSRVYKSKRVKKLKSWISFFSHKSRKYRIHILRSLEKKGLIRTTEKSFLFIPFKSTSLVKKRVREDIITNLRTVLLNGKNMNNQSASILGLIQACKIQKALCQDKNDLKSIKIKLREILKNDSISQDVDQVIKEMQAAIIGAVVVTGATGAIASGSG